MTSVSEKTAKHYITAFIIALAGVILDQLSKYMAVHFLQGTDGIDLIPGVFRLTYLENRGAAFGVLQGQQWFFYIITAVILVVVVLAYVRIPAGRKFLPLQICAVFIVSGALGNLIDRIALGFVTDMFDFHFWPVFNVADISVCVGAGFLVLYTLVFYGKTEKKSV